MTPEKRETAIKWLQNEIRSLRLAPTINGCGPENWADLLEIMQTCLEAVKGCFVDTNKMSPLTLNQLREMDGQPVWVVDVGPHKWYGPGWAIVDRDNCLVRTVKNWNAVFFESYGERWLAYRRPPEGEA